MFKKIGEPQKEKPKCEVCHKPTWLRDKQGRAVCSRICGEKLSPCVISQLDVRLQE